MACDYNQHKGMILLKRVLSITLTLILLVTAFPFRTSAVTQGVNRVDAVSVANVPAEPVELDGWSLLEQPQQAQSEQQVASSYAARAMAGVATFATAQYQNLSSSQNLIEILKDVEGFRSQPYYDYGQYSIGYGCFAGHTAQEAKNKYPNGISKAGAEALLREQLKTYENEVNTYMRRIGRQPTQCQFDALVDFTYNVGGNWTRSNDYLINKYLMNPTTDLDLVRALGSWCRAGGTIQGALCSRRIRCSLMFLYGIYYLPYGNNKDSNLKVVKDSDLPYFSYCVFNGNGATLSNGKSDDINFYAKGKPYGSLPKPSKSNFTFDGWIRSDGSLLTEKSEVKGNISVKARWKVGGGSSTPSGSGSSGGSGTNPSPSGKVPFRDVSAGSWYYSAVEYVYTKGYMNGMGDNLFNPEGTMTRAMLVTVLYRLAGQPAAGSDAGFQDVNSSHYFYKAVCWAKAHGVVIGVTAKEFRPNDLITRQQIAAIFYRYYVNYLGKTAQNSGSLASFQDRDSISEYAKDAMAWAVGVGLMKGMTANTLNPGGNATRAQAATIIERFSKMI